MKPLENNRRRLIRCTALAALVGALPLHAVAADEFAGKTIKIIVPFSAGGSSDIIARAISTPLAEALKATVIVDNKVGANGNIGADFVAKSAPNGLVAQGADISTMPPAEMSRFFDTERKSWAAVVAKAGLKLD